MERSRPARRPRLAVAAVAACAALAAVATALAGNYAYITTGLYAGTAPVQGATVGTVVFKGGSYKFSFRLTSATKGGIRTIRGMSAGPVPTLCTKRSTKVGVADTYVVHTLPRQTNFGPATTNGFIIRSWILSGGSWKPGKANVSAYTGPLPHVDLGFVYNTHPTRFNPNPLTSPSVIVTYRIDDSGKISRSGKFVCQAQSLVTVLHKS